MKIVRRGALPVGGDSGLAEIRALRGGGLRRGRRGAATVRPEDVWPASSSKVLSFVDVDAIRPLRVVVDAANGMAGVDAAARPRAAAAARRRALLLRAGRDLPEPRAEPAAPGEPRVHRREDARGGRRPRRRVRRRRRPLLLRRRHGRVRPGRLRHRAPRRGGAREEPGRRRCIYDVRASWAVPGDDRARRRRSAREPRRARVHQAPDARGGRRLRRRGLGALLLPRLLAGRHRRRPVPAHARAALAARREAVGDPRARSASATSSPARSTRRSRTSR